VIIVDEISEVKVTKITPDELKQQLEEKYAGKQRVELFKENLDYSGKKIRKVVGMR